MKRKFDLRKKFFDWMHNFFYSDTVFPDFLRFTFAGVFSALAAIAFAGLAYKTESFEGSFEILVVAFLIVGVAWFLLNKFLDHSIPGSFKLGYLFLMVNILCASFFNFIKVALFFVSVSVMYNVIILVIESIREVKS